MDGEKIDKLIVLVAEYSELYDMAHKNYSNQHRREIIWTEIGNKLNEKAEVCKQRWKTLRDAFQRAAKNNHTKSGQAAKGNKKWKYWDAMAFLQLHIKDRETHSNVSQIQQEDISDDDEVDTRVENNTQSQRGDILCEDYDAENSLDIPSFVSQPNTPSCSSSVETPSRPSSRVTNVKSVQRCKTLKAAVRNDESIPEILKEYVDDKKRSRLEKQTKDLVKPSGNENSPLIDFFINMGKTTATFPPLWQATVKSKVFQIVNSYELQMFSKSSSLITQTSSECQILGHTQTPSQIHETFPLQPPMQIQSPMQNPPSVQTRPPMQQQSSVQDESSTFFGETSTYYSQFATQLPHS